MTTFEIVTFPLVDGADETAFLGAAGRLNERLRTMPGFRRRWLGRGEDGLWTDVVEWDDLATAKAAAAAFPSLPEAAAFGAMIDFSRTRMQHVEIAMAS